MNETNRDNIIELMNDNERLRAERDALTKRVSDLLSGVDEANKRWLETRAERDALLAGIERAARVMRGEGVDDQGEAYDQCQRILDAAIDAARSKTPAQLLRGKDDRS